MPKTNERVHFRLLNPTCCRVLLCWVNPRLPNYCPECGMRVFSQIRECVLVSDDQAWLKIDYDVAPTIHDLNAESCATRPPGGPNRGEARITQRDDPRRVR